MDSTIRAAVIFCSLAQSLVLSEDVIPSLSEVDCSKSTDCDLLPENATCFDTTLPYNSVSFSFTGLQNKWNTISRLNDWSVLKSVPKCWAVIQPLLCAVYLPKCEDGRVNKVPRQLCSVVQNPCRIVTAEKEWPSFLDCNNASIFTTIVDQCEADDGPRKIFNKFNTTGSCSAPFLKKTTEPLAYYQDIDECGLSCFDPAFSRDEHYKVRSGKQLLFSFGITCSLFMFITLLIRKSSKARMTEHVLNQILLYLHFCYVLVCIGLLVQFSFEIDENDVVCRTDNTLRISEPNTGHNYNCAIVFALVYYGDFAFTIWLTFFLFVFNASIKTSPSSKENLGQHLTYFHMVAWIIPAVFTLTAFFVNAIDGYSLSGICHISMYSRNYELGTVADLTWVSWFVFLPQCLLVVIAVLVLGKLFMDLTSLSKRTPAEHCGTISEKKLRICVSAIPIILAKFVNILISIYVAVNTQSWDRSRHEFLVCKIWRNECINKERQNILTVHLNMLCLAVPGFFTLVLTYDQVKSTWTEFLRHIFLPLCLARDPQRQGNGPKAPKIKKHELIRKAYAKRHDFGETGRLSVSIDNELPPHPKIGIDSRIQQPSGSEDFSETWANALPRLIYRRNAVFGAEQICHSQWRANSTESLASLSRASSIRIKKSSWVYDSKRHSIAAESQLSLRQSELDHLESLYQSSKKKQRRSKHSFFKRHGSSKKFRSTLSSRRSSFTSQDTNASIDARSLQSAISLDPRRLPASLAVTDQNKDEYFELNQRLKQLVNASMTSAEANKQGSVKAVQTSLTDLSGLSNRPRTQDASVQCSISLIETLHTAPTTTSSSQTEDKALISRYPIDAHVTQIRVHHEVSSGDSSSIPSSYDRDYDKSKRIDHAQFPSLNNVGYQVPHHNRGRRGGIVDIRTACVDDKAEDNTLDELELNCRNEDFE